MRPVALAIALCLAGCAGAGGVRLNGRVVWERTAAVPAAARWGAPPAWVKNPPKDGAYRYFVGEFEGDGSVDEALARAWASGMFRAGVTEFPEVADVEATGQESLHGARFERHFAVALGAIDWSELDEAREKGSPSVEMDERTGNFRVFRLLQWKKSAIAAARRKIASARRGSLVPRTAPATRNSAAHADRRRWMERLVAGGRCRGDVDEAVEALGPPDRLAREPERPELRHYFWGGFRLTARLPDRNIVQAARVLGGADESALCSGSLAARPPR